MKYEDVKKLLESCKSQQKIALKLMKEANRDPDFPFQTWPLRRNILHLLVLYNMPDALEKLLKDPKSRFEECLKNQDGGKNNPLALAVRCGPEWQPVVDVIEKHKKKSKNKKKEKAGKSKPTTDAQKLQDMARSSLRNLLVESDSCSSQSLSEMYSSASSVHLRELEDGNVRLVDTETWQEFDLFQSESETLFAIYLKEKARDLLLKQASVNLEVPQATRRIEDQVRSECTLFHLLVLINWYQPLKTLFDDSSFCDLAYRSDKWGDTIMHYAIQQGKEWKKILGLIIEKYPELLTVANWYQQTPLDTARRERQKWAERLINKALKNYQKKEGSKKEGSKIEVSKKESSEKEGSSNNLVRCKEIREKGVKALFETGWTQEAIATHLQYWIREDPQSLFSDFIDECTLLHLTVLKNMSVVINRLLHDPSFNSLVSKANIAGNTLLHYVVRLSEDEDRKRILKTILETHPNLFEVRNCKGNTALQEAQEKKRSWAQTILQDYSNANENELIIEFPFLSAYSESSTPRSDGGTPRSDSGTPRSDSGTPRSDSGTPRSDSGTPRSESSTPRSDSASPRSDSSTPRSNSIDSDENNSKSRTRRFLGVLTRSRTGSKPREISNLKNVSFQDSPLITLETLIAADKNNDREYYDHLLGKFCEQCQQVDLTSFKDRLTILFKDCRFIDGILRDVLLNLRNEAAILNQKKIKERSQLSLKLQNSLLCNGLGQQTPVRSPQYFDDFDGKNSEFLENLWWLTACKEHAYSPQSIDNIPGILDRILCIRYRESFETIVSSLRKLYPYFNTQQKLMAHYIISHLASNQIVDSTQFSECEIEINAFKECNTCDKHGLPSELAKELNIILDQMAEYGRKHYNHPLLINAHFLTAKYEELPQSSDNSSRKTDSSFKELLEIIFSTPWKERNVTPIVQEIRGASIRLYDDIKLKELVKAQFDGKGDSDKVNSGLSMRMFIENLGAVFREFVLDKSDNIDDAMYFVFQITRALCLLNIQDGPDINGTMVLSAVLNHFTIARFWGKSSDKRIVAAREEEWKEIEKITDPNRHYFQMQKLRRRDESAIPPWNLFTKELEMNRQNDETKRAENTGKILNGIIGVKQRQPLPPARETNLIELLIAHEPVENDELYKKSQQLKPRTLDLDMWDAFNILNKLDELRAEYLDNKLIPGCRWTEKKEKKSSSKTYTIELPPSNLALKLLKRIETIINSCELDIGTLEIYAENMRSELKKTFNQLIKVNNTEYKKEHPNINSVFIFKRIDEIKGVIDNMLEEEKKAKSQENVSPTVTESNSSGREQQFFLSPQDTNKSTAPTESADETAHKMGL